jgi:putative exporter of polyketide antibiotics
MPKRRQVRIELIERLISVDPHFCHCCFIRKERSKLINKIVLSMAALRILSGSIEIIAALLMLRYNQIEKALMVNTGLAMVGPFVLLTTTTLGLIGLADKLSVAKMLWVLAGVSCIFIGILRK